MKMFVLQVILGIVLCIGVLLWWWQRSARLYWENNGVSYIPGPPLIGALKDSLLFRKSFGELFLEFYNHEKFKNDPITGAYFFHKPSLVIRHPEVIKNILVKDFPNFMDRGISSHSNDIIGMDNLFMVKGERWRRIRHKLTPFLTTGKLKNFFHLMMNVTEVLEQKLSMEIDAKPREYEMKELSAIITTDIIAICAFGIQANTLLNPNCDFYMKAKKSLEFNWNRAIQLATCYFLPNLAKWLHCTPFSRETNEFVRSTIANVIEERIKSGGKRNDLIDILIDMKKEDSDFYRGDTLAAQAAIFLLAGYEAPANAIALALYELAMHPEIQEKLIKEIKIFVEKYESVTYETINEMDYLTCVVQEIIRLYPILPFVDRICTPINGKDSYSLEPYHQFAIPRGMPVYIPAIAINRDPKYFENPLEFIPERFSAENRDSKNHNASFSFGQGPRMCIGARLGYLQVKLALFAILRNYRIEATERTPKTIEFDKKAFTLQSKAPLFMNLTKN